MTRHPHRTITLLGDPVAHSLSPRMHNAGFRAAGLDAEYVAVRCEPSDLGRIIRSLVAAGGAGNITVPYKIAATEYGVGDSRVSRLGMANVFFGTEIPEQVSLANTDVDGLLALVDGLSQRPARWLVVGTGGSARAVAAAALERGAAIASLSRDRDRGLAFEEWCRGMGGSICHATDCELLVNATPVGLHPHDPLPTDLAAWPRLEAVLDLPYRVAGTTALVEAARARGLEAADGREMLLIQGIAAWQYWFPGVVAPVEVMRDALRHGAD